ncbi:MAG: beta-ketoacyl-ACP synthase II [Chloroflexi bacterium]|nr:beta-ketoacyl-ACP synthase II [Chloroflexota bacterium]
MSRRVVVTGLGALSPLGTSVAQTWAGICEGQSGIATISRFDPGQLRTTFAGEIKGLDPAAHFGPKEARRLDPCVQYAVIAAREALADAQYAPTPEQAERTAVIIGSGIGGINTLVEQSEVLRQRGPARVSPFFIPMILPETGASMVAIEFGLRGPNLAVTSACATGANAIGEAAEMIRRGVVDAAVCGATEAPVVPIAFAGFSVMRAISERNATPQSASRPFDRDRDGFVISEGAAVLVLEALETAQARGARIYAELAGYGSTDDAFHLTAPLEDGAGAVACMRKALAWGELAPEAIDAINPHGTSTPLNDATETRAIRTVFGARAERVPIGATKSMTGHLLGAAGALEAVLSILTLRDGIVPPTINLENPDPACDLDYVPHTARRAAVSTILSNSFGFGGHNACLVFRRMDA